MSASAELLGERDEDALRTADVAEPVAVLVSLQLTDELGAVRLEAGEDVLDVLDGERDATDAQRVHRRVLRLSGDRLRVVELRSTSKGERVSYAAALAAAGESATGLQGCWRVRCPSDKAIER